jgi:hypothetical protein
MERRESTRKGMSYFLDVKNINTSEILGKLINISEKGLRLISKQPFLVDDPFDISLSYITPKKDIKDFSSKIICRWVKYDDDNGIYTAGFEFTDTGTISPEDFAVMLRIL